MSLWYGRCMPVSFHSLMLLRRTVILLLLGLLLPLQSTLAYARSIAMLAPVSPILVVMPMVDMQGAQQHHATHNNAHNNAHNTTHQATQHSTHQSSHHSVRHVSAAVVSDQLSGQPSEQSHHTSVAAKSCHSPEKNSSACHDCAKCCLIGAAAPPSCTTPSQSFASVRSVFTAATHPLSGFIPDGLERPPRISHA